jgi:hypothetical protein
MDLIFKNPLLHRVDTDMGYQVAAERPIEGAPRLGDLYRHVRPYPDIFQQKRANDERRTVPSLAELCFGAIRKSARAMNRLEFDAERALWSVPVSFVNDLLGHGIMCPRILDDFTRVLNGTMGDFTGQAFIAAAKFTGFVNWFLTKNARWKDDHLGTEFAFFIYRVRPSVCGYRQQLAAIGRSTPLLKLSISFAGLWNESKHVTFDVFEDYMNKGLFRSIWGQVSFDAVTCRVPTGDECERGFRRVDLSYEQLRCKVLRFETHFERAPSGVMLSRGFLAALDLQRLIVVDLNDANQGIATRESIARFRISSPTQPAIFQALATRFDVPSAGDRHDNTYAPPLFDALRTITIGVPMFCAVPPRLEKTRRFVLFCQMTGVMWVFSDALSNSSACIGGVGLGPLIRRAFDDAMKALTPDVFTPHALPEGYVKGVITNPFFLTLSAQPFYSAYESRQGSSVRYLLRVYIPIYVQCNYRAVYKSPAPAQKERCFHWLGCIELLFDTDHDSFNTFNVSNTVPLDNFSPCIVRVTANIFTQKSPDHESVFLQRMREFEAFADWAKIFLGQDIFIDTHGRNDALESRFMRSREFPWTRSFTSIPEHRLAMCIGRSDIERIRSKKKKNESTTSKKTKRTFDESSSSSDEATRVALDALCAAKSKFCGVSMIFDQDLLDLQMACVMQLDADVVRKRVNKMSLFRNDDTVYNNVFPFDAGCAVAVMDLYAWWRHEAEADIAKEKGSAQEQADI